MSDFVISGARIFDGESVLAGPHDVVVADGLVSALRPSNGVPPGAVDGSGGTVLPGLIDAHVHADRAGLRQALLFGVTTALDMGSSPEIMDPLRRECATHADLADVRSAVTGLTHPCGHPHQLAGDLGHPATPTVTDVEQVGPFVADRIAEGADYLKTWLEDGEVLRHPVMPLDPAILDAFVRVGHAHGLRVLVHALTRAATERVVASGADGLTHLFLDQPHTEDLVAGIRDSGMHVVATLALLASLAGDTSAGALADEPRVQRLLAPPALTALRSTWSTMGPEHLDTALRSLAALHRAGVPVLAGTDASLRALPGLAAGVSLHHELRLLVRAGLDPVDALRAATAVPADRFALADRGRVAPGKRADLLLVDGDPTTNIDESTAIRRVWRGGVDAEA